MRYERVRNRPWSMVLLAIALWGCEGAMQSESVEAPPPGHTGSDAGTEPDGSMSSGGSDMGQVMPAEDMDPDMLVISEDCTMEEGALEHGVMTFLEQTCSNSGCHLPAGQRAPSLAGADLAALVASGGFDPASPDGGWVMQRIDTTNPSMIMPPTREANRPEDITMLRNWLAAGAPTGCVAPPEPEKATGNDIPQAQLFTCSEPDSMPREYRRLGADEFMLAVGGKLSTKSLGSNPLRETTSLFSTFGDARSLNETALAIYLNTLEGSREFRSSNSHHGDPDGRTYADQLWIKSLSAEDKDALSCILNDRRAPDEVLADEPCITLYVTELLHRGVLHYEPSEEEVALIKGFLQEELAREPNVTDRRYARPATLSFTSEAAWMMSGALFPSLRGDTQGLLGMDEYGRALNRALTSAPMHGATHGEFGRPEQGWITAFHDTQAMQSSHTKEDLAALGSSVFDLQAGFVGGEFDIGTAGARPDLFYDYTHTKEVWRLPRRGRYWLAPRIAEFFREYFSYGDVSSVAKIDPGATSIYFSQDFGRTSRSNVEGGFTINRDGARPSRGAHGEPMIVEQLDDMIARAVIQAERDGEDVFRALFTSRTYRVPAVISAEGFVDYRSVPQGSCDPVVCNATRDAGCCPQGTQCLLEGFDAQDNPQGYCMRSSFSGFRHVANVYQILPIDEDPATSQASADKDWEAPLRDPAHQARWVEMPQGKRAGVLTHPAWLSKYGSNAEEDASAVLRGHWIREHLFCEAVGGLDLVNLEAQLPASDGTQRARDRLHQTFGDLSLPVAQRTQGDPRCSNGACHGAMNTLGMPFEIYNHAGFLRHDDHGFSPDGSATISNWPGRLGELIEVGDATELMDLIADDPHARRCFLRHVFRYFMGRYETQADACVLADMEAAFASGSFFAALDTLMTHDAFLVRGAQ